MRAPFSPAFSIQLAGAGPAGILEHAAGALMAHPAATLSSTIRVSAFAAPNSRGSSSSRWESGFEITRSSRRSPAIAETMSSGTRRCGGLRRCGDDRGGGGHCRRRPVGAGVAVQGPPTAPGMPMEHFQAGQRRGRTGHHQIRRPAPGGDAGGRRSRSCRLRGRRAIDDSPGVPASSTEDVRPLPQEPTSSPSSPAAADQAINWSRFSGSAKYSAGPAQLETRCASPAAHPAARSSRNRSESHDQSFRCRPPQASGARDR